MMTLAHTLLSLAFLGGTQVTPVQAETRVFAVLPAQSQLASLMEQNFQAQIFQIRQESTTKPASPFLLPTAGSSSSAAQSSSKTNTSTPAASTVVSSATETSVILALVNAERRKVGLQPLTRNTLLDQAALTHARNMHEQQFFSHTGKDGSTPLTRIRATGYLNVGASKKWSFSVAENIAKGQPGPEKVMRDWMLSPKHRANILTKDFREMGIAVYARTWVQTFGFINK